VRLIDEKGEQLGVLSTRQALDAAKQAGLNLVEVSPNAKPPVCRIMDYGKYRYSQGKKQKQRSKQTTTKEIKLRPATEIADYLLKVKKILAFIEKGYKVKVTVRFRGREITHHNLGMDLLKRIEGDVSEHANVEQFPKFEGRQIVMIIAPKKT